jgi:hypothetical protein
MRPVTSSVTVLGTNCPRNPSYNTTLDAVATELRSSGSFISIVGTTFNGTSIVPLAGLTVSIAGAVMSTSLTVKPPKTVRTWLLVVTTTSRGPSVAFASIVMFVVICVGPDTTFELTVTPAP